MSQPGFGKMKESNDKRLKILHIAGWYPSKKNPVAGVFVREHVKATALYNDVVVLYSEGISTGIRGLYEIEDNIEDGIRTLRLRYRKSPIPKTSYFIYLWAMFRAFRKLVREGWYPDVIHAHVYSAGVPAVLLGKKHHIPVIITEHFTGFRQGYLFIRGLEKAKAKFVFSHAVLVCPVSKALEEDIKKLGLPGRFCVVPNVVDTTLFSPGEKKTQHKHPSDKKRLLFVGGLIPRKGLPFLLQALAHLKRKRNDFVLDIVGIGPNQAEYEALTKQLGLEGVVKFLGRLPSKKEVAELMKQCDFFVLPSLFENFAVVLIEAMACGKPVIATDIGGPNEVVTNEVGLLVPPGNSEALAEAIDYMLNHYWEYDSEKITQYVQQRYSYQVVGKKLDELYRTVLRKDR